VKLNANFILAALLAAVFAGAIATAVTFPPVASVFPYLIGGIGLALALAAVLVESRSARNLESDEAKRDEENDDGRRREISAGLWILGFFAAVGLIGFQWGLPLAVALNYQFECRVRVVTAVLMGLVTAGFVYLTIANLHISLYEGLLFAR
jgi:uncharacterized membrane protein YfcA